MSRYRLVTRTTAGGNTETHVTSVVQTEREAVEGIMVEGNLAVLAGWKVRQQGQGAAIELRLARGGTTRVLSIRESGPFDDAIA